MFKYNFINLIAAAFSFIWAVGGFINDGLWFSSLCFFAAGILFTVNFFAKRKNK